MRRPLSVCLFALLPLGVSAAEAQPLRDANGAPLSSALSEAREAFRLGAELARAARWDEARLAFKHSSELKEHPITTYNIGFCNRAVGRPAGALRYFQRALNEHESGAHEKMTDDLVAVTQQYLAEARARVARVTLSGVGQTSLLVDGHPLEPVQSVTDPAYVVAEEGGASAPLPAVGAAILLLDPGTHVFVANRPGQAEAVETRALAAGEQVELTLHFHALTPEQKPLQKVTAPRTRQQRRGVDPRWYYLTFGVGGAGLIVGGIAGVAAVQQKSNLNAICGPSGNECPTASRDDIDALRRTTTISTVATSVGFVGIAAGLSLVLLSPKRSAASSPSLALSVAGSGLALHGALP